ncbi:MAG: hypothetical protein AB7T49_11280 [Oligoflexales bacterium]
MSKLCILLIALTFGCTSNQESHDLGARSDNSGNVTSFYVEALHQNDILVLGESHQNLRIVKNFNQILKDFEEKYPGQLALVGLEVFSVYQPEIDRFLDENGPNTEQILLNTPDREALRGTRDEIDAKGGRTPVVSSLFLEVYRTIKDINSKRRSENKIRIIAVDKQPAANVIFREYQKNRKKLIDWAVARDSHMFEQLEHPIRSLPKNRSALVYIGSSHAQRGGIENITLPPESGIDSPKVIKWLTTRLVEGFPQSKVVSAEQINPGNASCEAIEGKLSADGVAEPMAIDLRSSPLGDIENFRGCDDFPVDGATVDFDPTPYKAKDHFDFYTYYPPEKR